jgi:hypothetical protein
MIERGERCYAVVVYGRCGVNAGVADEECRTQCEGSSDYRRHGHLLCDCY